MSDVNEAIKRLKLWLNDQENHEFNFADLNAVITAARQCELYAATVTYRDQVLRQAWEKAGFSNPGNRDATFFAADVISYLFHPPAHELRSRDARTLREAADKWRTIVDMVPNTLAESWLRAEADRIERGES